MDIPQGGLIGKAAGVIRRVQKMNIPSHAANAGYFIVVAVFPMLVLVLSILRYTDLDAADLMELISVYIPRTLVDDVEKLIIQTYAYSGAAVVSVSAVGALWSASRGLFGVLKGLNAIYGVEERRGWFYTRSISVVYTFAFLVVLVLSLVLSVFGEQILALLPVSGKVWRFLSGIVDLRYLLMLPVQTALFAAMFMFLPNKHNTFRSSLPGAVFASLGWIVFSEVFSIYVDNWNAYSNIYGSMYAIALAMLWLYFCISILFYGGALNKLLEERK